MNSLLNSLLGKHASKANSGPFFVDTLKQGPPQITTCYRHVMVPTCTFAITKTAVCMFCCELVHNIHNCNGCSLIAPRVYCESHFEDGGWALVRRVKHGRVWHEASDDLAGKHAYGGYGTPTSDFSFSLPWTSFGFSKFLFMTGACNAILLFSVESNVMVCLS